MSKFGIKEKIQQRRLQVLVHSYIYYDLDQNIVSDQDWMRWAQELVQLQKEYPDIAEQVIYAETFKDFDGSSGADLNYKNEQIIGIANRLLGKPVEPEKPKQIKKRSLF